MSQSPPSPVLSSSIGNSDGIAYRGRLARDRALPSFSECRPIEYFPSLLGDGEGYRNCWESPTSDEERASVRS
jgi:hypothetical protein